jgi:hypothetical protein
MQKLIVVVALLLAVTVNAQAQTLKSHGKRYGFTHTIRMKGSSKEHLLQAVHTWVKANLVSPDYVIRDMDPEEAYITGEGRQTTKSGTSTYDLTFYVKRNVVDVVADNVSHSRQGRAPRGERGSGTLRKKTKNYLHGISTELREYLREQPAEATVSNK